MKKILWSLILCLTCMFVSAQTAEDMGNLIQTRLNGFSVVEIPQSGDDYFIASFIGDDNITTNQAKKAINKRIINAYDDVMVIEPWAESYDYDLPTEVITLYVDNNEDDAVFSIGIAVVEIDKYHTAITMLISRASKSALDFEE